MFPLSFLLPYLIGFWIAWAGVYATPLQAETTSSHSPQLIELFSVADNPGQGSLIYTNAGKPETITLGSDSGLYGLAMIFNGKVLPLPYQKEFERKQIIQVALGALKSKRPDTVAQFGAVTLIADSIPKGPTRFQLVTPSEREGQTRNTALLLFTSPSTRQDQSDEDKLKYTYFAKAGTVELTPLDRPSEVALMDNGHKVLFERTSIRLTFKARLATPFNTTENSLSGKVQFLLFWPKDKSAESLTTRIAAESLNPAGATADSSSRQPASASPH